jgi:hypothetical protein
MPSSLGAGSHLALRSAAIEAATTLAMAVSLERTSVFVQGSETADVVTRVEVHSRVSTGQSLPAGSSAPCTMATVMAASSALRRLMALRGTLRTLTPERRETWLRLGGAAWSDRRNGRKSAAANGDFLCSCEAQRRLCLRGRVFVTRGYTRDRVKASSLV